MVDKSNQTIPVASLKPIPVCVEPFSQVIVDCVGPLPKTPLSNRYLLTILCKFSHFLEAIPLQTIKAPYLAESLVMFSPLLDCPP